MPISDKIETLRKEKGWSQEELAGRLHVSRQSVSKWELGQSVPDISRILQLSEVFDCTTDYLLKDGKRPEMPEMESGERVLDPEEAETFLTVSRKWAIRYSLAVPAILLAVIPLIVNSESESDSTYGLCLAILIAVVAIATGVFIYGGMEMDKWEWVEKERFVLYPGLAEAILQNKEQFETSNRKDLVTGICLCTLSPVSIFLGQWMGLPESKMVWTVAILLVFIAFGTSLIVEYAMTESAYEKLLQIKDWRPEKKRAR